MTSGEASEVTSQESVYESILNLVGHDHVTISASHESSRPTSQHRALSSTTRIRDKLDRTPLHLASRNGKSDIVPLLLDRGADVDARNWNQATSARREARCCGNTTQAGVAGTSGRGVSANTSSARGILRRRAAASRLRRRCEPTPLGTLECVSPGGVQMDTRKLRNCC